MSEEQIKKLVEQAIEKCPMKTGYADLSQQVGGVKKDVGALKKDVEVVREDVEKISFALLGNGNKYHKEKGIIEKIEYSYKHSKTCVDTKVIERLEPVIEHYVDWKKQKKWVTLDDMIEDRKTILKLKLWFNVGSWAGIVSFIISIGVLVGILKDIIKF